MKKILILEESPGFGGALVSLKTFLSNVSSNFYSFYIITAYQQEHIKTGGLVKDVQVFERRRLYGYKSRSERVLKKIAGKKAGPLLYCLDRLTLCRKYVGRLAKYINDNDIDLVHLNNWPLLNDGGIFAAKKKKVPIIMHVRGFEYEGRLITWLVRQADHIIAVSHYIKNRISALKVDASKISVIPDAIDTESFVKRADGALFRKEIGLNEEEFIIGFPACLVSWKGHRWFLKSCQQIFREIMAYALIIGDTPDGKPEFKEELKAYAAELGIANNVIFVGHRNDIESAMDACNIIVHASTIPEPFGRTIIEGMALGKPVIATDMGGPRDIIEHFKNGFLVPAEKPEILAKTALMCLRNPQLCQEIGTIAKDIVIRKFNVKNHVEQIESVYQEALK